MRAVYNFLPPTGYDTDFYIENLPTSVDAGYENQTTGQNINVSAVENLSGNTIDLTDFVIESSFLNPVEIKESVINGTRVFQSMVALFYPLNRQKA